MNLYSLFVYIEHNGDETPKDLKNVSNCLPVSLCNNPVVLVNSTVTVRTSKLQISHTNELFLQKQGISLSGGRLPAFNPLNPELNLICYLLALLGAHHFPHVSRMRVKLLTFRLLMSYIHGAPILDVSRSHTTTQHSR